MPTELNPPLPAKSFHDFTVSHLFLTLNPFGFCVPRKHWKTWFAGECLFDANDNTARSVLPGAEPWAQWPMRQDNSDQTGPSAVISRMSHPMLGKKSSFMLNIAFAVIFLDPFCHTAKQFTLSCWMREKYFSFLFLMEILKESNF
ncbi:uncharacterized protein RBU33_015228 [Hipposideros larvatus]